MAKTDSRTSKSIKNSSVALFFLFHQPDPPVLFKEDFLGLFGGGGTGVEYHGSESTGGP